MPCVIASTGCTTPYGVEPMYACKQEQDSYVDLAYFQDPSWCALGMAKLKLHCHPWLSHATPPPPILPPPILSHFGNFWRRYHPCLSRHNDFSLIVENLKIKNSTWRPKGFLFKGKIPAYQIPELEFLVESDQVELGHMLPRVPACMLCAAANHVQVSTHHVVSLGSTLPCSLGTHGSKFPPHEALVLHCLSQGADT